MTAAERLADLAERFWQTECAASSLTALLAGEASSAPYLFRDSAADLAARDAAAAVMLDELSAIPVAGLNAQDAVTHALLHRDLASFRRHYAVKSHQRPWLLPLGPEFNTVFFANAMNIADADSAELYVARLESIPAWLDNVRANLADGHAGGFRFPRVVLDGAMAAARGAASATNAVETPWYGPFKRSAVVAQPRVAAAAERAAGVIETAVLPAMHGYADFLAGPLSDGARETIACTDAPGGADYYRAWVGYFTTTDDSPDAIHALGLAEVARIEIAMDAIAAEAGFPGDLPGYRRFLMTDPQFVMADSETLRERLEILCKRIDKRIPAFFGRIPRITYGVESIPAAMSAKLPPAYAQPSPADGAVAGILWVTGLPDRCPSYMHVALALHEAWPGHLMHIALMQETSGLPAFRRNGSVKQTALVEGWALYCETLGVEMGLYETPHQHFGRLEFEMWRAIRLVVDTGIHWLGWSRQAAIDYMMARLSLGLDTITQEVDRYIAMPAQALAYQIGNLKIRELRARVEAVQGERFSHRDFHAAIMSAGAVTLPILEATIDAWLAAEAPRAAA